jgi:hypothetical protein
MSVSLHVQSTVQSGRVMEGRQTLVVAVATPRTTQRKWAARSRSAAGVARHRPPESPAPKASGEACQLSPGTVTVRTCYAESPRTGQLGTVSPKRNG